MSYQGHEYALKHESEIVWLVEDLENYPWVRETCTDFYHPKKIAKSRLTIKTGMNQTDIVTTALIKYLDLEDEMSSVQRLDALEKRVSKLENND
jgi:hypothetical protein